MAKGCSEKTQILSRIAAVVVIFSIAVALSPSPITSLPIGSM